jgi:hypothetical protein
MKMFRTSDVNLGHLGADVSILRYRTKNDSGVTPKKTFCFSFVILGALNMGKDVICRELSAGVVLQVLGLTNSDIGFVY